MPATKTKLTSANEKRQSSSKIKPTDSGNKQTKKTASVKAEQTTQLNSQAELDLICDQSTLDDYLDFVSRGIPHNPTLPILNNVLFEADATEQLLHLTTYNLEFGMKASMKAKILSSGAMTLPMAVFQQMVRKFPHGEIGLSSNITASSQESDPQLKATLSTPTDPSKRFEFMGMVADEFPALPKIKAKLITLPANLLVTQLSGSLFAASSDETKKILNGSHFMFDCDSERELDSLKTWTTDGHRMAFMQGLIERKSKETITEPISFTIPIKVLRELERNLNPSEKVTIYFEPSPNSETEAGVAIFEWSNKRLVTHTLEGQYPDCEAAIKPLCDQYCRFFTVERIALQKTLERFIVLTDKSHKAMTVQLDSKTQKVCLRMEHDCIGSGTETLDIQMPGDDLKLLYDVRYLLEIVKAISTSEIRIHLATPITPTLIQPLGLSSSNGIPVEAEYILAPLAGSE
ncbi:MAG: DNA polymerase III subunit beta [Hydrococcus sp. Prado102]|nr:DNA polymerase III subunit beta [Hydrococcus sp. Prado102]